MWVGRVWAQGRAAYVPTEVVELVTHIRCVDTANLLAEALRFGIDIQRHEPVRLLPGRVESDHVSERLDGCLRRQPWRRIKGLIGSEKGACHVLLLSCAQGGRSVRLIERTGRLFGALPRASDLTGTEAVRRLDEPVGRELNDEPHQLKSLYPGQSLTEGTRGHGTSSGGPPVRTTARASLHRS